MSILNVPEVSPSRIKGVVRYLLQARGKREKREILEAILSPATLTGKGDDKTSSRNMVKLTIRESIKAGLLEENNERTEITLSQKIGLTEETLLPFVLSELILNEPEYTENQDFAKVLAWYLSQDFTDAPGSWQETEQRLREQIGDGLLGLNDVRYGQFEDWSCYLGFCWRSILAGKQVLVPDPTVYLRQSLENLFENQSDRPIPMDDFVARLGKYCSVFEMGKFREEIEQQIGLRELNHLSPVTSIALRRLEEESLLTLGLISDASIWVLNDGSGNPRISHITWLGTKSNGGQL